MIIPLIQTQRVYYCAKFQCVSNREQTVDITLHCDAYIDSAADKASVFL